MSTESTRFPERSLVIVAAVAVVVVGLALWWLPSNPEDGGDVPEWTTYEGETFWLCHPGLRHSPYEDGIGVICEGTGHNWEHPNDATPHVVIDGVDMPCRAVDSIRVVPELFASVLTLGTVYEPEEINVRVLACAPSR